MKAGIMFALIMLLLIAPICLGDTGTGGLYNATFDVSESWSDTGRGSGFLYTATVDSVVWGDTGTGGVYSIGLMASLPMVQPNITSCTVLNTNVETHQPATMAMVLDTGTWPNEWLNEMYVRMLANGSQVTEANTWTDGTVYLVWSPNAAYSGNYTINCTWSGHGFAQSVAAGYINVTNVYPTLTNCTTDPHAVNTGEWVEGLATLVLGTWWSSDIGRLWLETNNITVADADTILAGENDIVWVTNNPGNYSMRCGLSGSYVNYTDYYNDSTVHVIGAGTWNISAWNLSTTAAPITGVCSNDTIPKVMMLFFIAFIIFGVLLLNLLVLRLPILNLLPAAGLIVFGISLFFCAWYLAFICWLLAIGIIVMSWSDT